MNYLVFGIIAAVILAIILIFVLIGPVMVGSNEVAIIEKKFSTKSLKNGEFIALHGEAGFQADTLGPGLHFRCRIIYRIYKRDRVTIKQGKIGYVFARSGQALKADQTLAKEIECSNFQDTRAFIENGGQKGPQRSILREGTYAFNLAQFVILTEEEIYFIPIGSKEENNKIRSMSQVLIQRDGFNPVVITSAMDNNTYNAGFNTGMPINNNGLMNSSIVKDNHYHADRDFVGVVTTFEGRSLPADETIAPIMGDNESNSNMNHNGFQNIERFINAGGYRGMQYQVLTDGTYFINRLFATVELKPKTVIDVSHVGVVNSFVGQKGTDVSGTEYTHGELVEEGCRGIWQTPLMPGKYPLNPYAQEVILVPTDNFALKWDENSGGQYEYDNNLKKLQVITKDGLKPAIPLSVVVHINYLQAPSMIQRFGSVTKLVEQTLDPMISAHFKHIAETKNYLELVQGKAGIAREVLDKMGPEFQKFNLELEDVLIDTPDDNGDMMIPQIMAQLSERQLAIEKMTTDNQKMQAAETERLLKEAQAKAAQQASLTESRIQIDIEKNEAEAEKQAAAVKKETMQINADAERYKKETEAEANAKQTRLSAAANRDRIEAEAEANAKKIKLEAEAEAQKISQLGLAEAEKIREVGDAQADANKKNVNAYGGPEMLVQKEIMIALAEAIKTNQNLHLVPQNTVSLGGQESDSNALTTLLKLLSIEKIKELVPDAVNEEKKTAEEKKIDVEMGNMENEKEIAISEEK
ncbi:MAG: SPFH domain-containing protein [Clostridiales bacterium]|nr:SPFH domain-containing protein [Clostridiales bacterium]MDD6060103.1 SPFH domain-containing protein [Ruminococcus sp.]